MQARAPQTQKFGKEAFDKTGGTQIRWLGNASAMINSRGTCVMLDPILSGFDMPLLIDMPILEEDVPFLDAVLLTHSDGDHFSRMSCKKLADKAKGFHAPHYVAGLLKEELGIDGLGHDIHETFTVGNINVTLTPVDHAWQNESPKHHTRDFKMEDYCGFWLDTPDGSIWMVGDSRLLEEQLHMQTPDVILMDISDGSWHIGFAGIKKMAAAYPDTPLIAWHWGSVDAPDWKEFNGNPEEIKQMIVNPERLIVLAPGEAYQLNRRQKK